MSSKSKTVFRYGLIGLVLGTAVGLYAVNFKEETQQPQKLDAKRGAQLGLALFDFIKKVSAL